jgi:hypothetical protein
MKHQIKRATQAQEGMTFTHTVHFFSKDASQGKGLDYIYVCVCVCVYVCALLLFMTNNKFFSLQISAIK